MLTREQLQTLSKELNINEYVIAREYFQLLFLQELYSNNFSNNIFFKGGTCIRLIYGGSRFSEDLDFTVSMDEKGFDREIERFFKQEEGKYPIRFKQRDTLVGKTYLATIEMDSLKQDVYIKLDFSFREDIIEPSKEIIGDNNYPIIFKEFIYCLSINELFAEKIRAFLNRVKYRDIYDLWILLELGANHKKTMIQKKLDYYDMSYSKDEVKEKIKSLSKKQFVEEMRPFVPVKERDNLEKLFDYICEYLNKSLQLS